MISRRYTFPPERQLSTIPPRNIDLRERVVLIAALRRLLQATTTHDSHHLSVAPPAAPPKGKDRPIVPTG